MFHYRLFAILVWASAALAALISSGQATAAKGTPLAPERGGVRQSQAAAPAGLVEARRAFEAAAAKADRAAYAKFLTDDVTWINRAGRLQDKTSLVDGLRATTPSSTPAVDIRAYPGGAVVIGTRNGSIRYLQVWVQKGAQWQLAAHHGTTIAGANPPADPLTEAPPSSKSPASVGAPTDLEAIANAFDALNANNAKGDAAGFGRLVTEGFVAIGEDGKVLSRDARMREIASSKPPVLAAGAREDVSTRVHGDVAISTYLRPASAGQPGRRHTVVHVRQGVWRRAAIITTEIHAGR